jgi:hypothetical protein
VVNENDLDAFKQKIKGHKYEAQLLDGLAEYLKYLKENQEAVTSISTPFAKLLEAQAAPRTSCACATYRVPKAH